MKKNITFAITIFIFVFIIIYTCAYFLGSPRIKGHLYFGDHIALGLNVKIDGNEIPASNLLLTCNGGKDKVKRKENGYQVKGGNYGMYSFNLVVPVDSYNGLSNDLTFQLNYLNSNNWYIVDIDCDISLAATDKGYVGTLDIVTSYNDGSVDKLTKEINIDNIQNVSVYWGI